MKCYLGDVSVARVYLDPVFNPTLFGPNGEKPPSSGETRLSGLRAITVPSVSIVGWTRDLDNSL